jgi:hypothetical protein
MDTAKGETERKGRTRGVREGASTIEERSFAALGMTAATARGRWAVCAAVNSKSKMAPNAIQEQPAPAMEIAA